MRGLVATGLRRVGGALILAGFVLIIAVVVHYGIGGGGDQDWLGMRYPVLVGAGAAWGGCLAYAVSMWFDE